MLNYLPHGTPKNTIQRYHEAGLIAKYHVFVKVHILRCLRALYSLFSEMLKMEGVDNSLYQPIESTVNREPTPTSHKLSVNHLRPNTKEVFLPKTISIFFK